MITNRAIDAHVQGLYDPYAPFNRDDDFHPLCNKCEVEECKEPCKKVLDVKEENDKEMQKEEKGLYLSYLLDLSSGEIEHELDKGNIELVLDWIALTNIMETE